MQKLKEYMRLFVHGGSVGILLGDFFLAAVITVATLFALPEMGFFMATLTIIMTVAWVATWVYWMPKLSAVVREDERRMKRQFTARMTDIHAKQREAKAHKRVRVPVFA